jgi:hypothetical protein
MNTTRRDFDMALSNEQRALRAEIIEKVRAIMTHQYAGRVAEAQKAYEYLQGWCYGKGVDFDNAYSGAVRYLQQTAVGTLDAASSHGHAAKRADVAGTRTDR